MDPHTDSVDRGSAMESTESSLVKIGGEADKFDDGTDTGDNDLGPVLDIPETPD